MQYLLATALALVILNLLLLTIYLGGRAIVTVDATVKFRRQRKAIVAIHAEVQKAFDKATATEARVTAMLDERIGAGRWRFCRGSIHDPLRFEVPMDTSSDVVRGLQLDLNAILPTGCPVEFTFASSAGKGKRDAN